MKARQFTGLAHACNPDIVTVMDSATHSGDNNSLLSQPPQRLSGASGQVRLFSLYNAYRALGSLSLLTLLVIPESADLVRGFDRPLFLGGAGALLLTAVALAGDLGQRLRGSETGVFGLMLFDIIAEATVVGATGGILSGFSVLYLITVAAAAVMLKTRILATLVAAIAVLAVLADTFWLVSRGEADLGMLLPAGLLGSLLFAVSLLVQLTANRLAQAEAQADAAESQVIALQNLNQQIIVHMQTGILLVNREGQATAINKATERLLSLPAGQLRDLAMINATLATQFQQWVRSGHHRPEPFRMETDAPAVIATFAELGENRQGDNLVFIEDYTPVTQFAQSLKLDSLSKMTASIAHEIRNPLSAISHGAQLLSESNTIDAADRILCDILVSNSQRVSDIIENVMEVSRRQAPRPDTLNLNQWLVDFIREYSAQRTDEALINFSGAPEQVAVSVDPQHLRRVLSNLLDNGLRHSMEDSQRHAVNVEVAVEAPAGLVHLDIIDFGFGVSEANLSRLFEPFFTTSSQGSGLGLYLCKELCEINGAGLTYRPTSNGESAFRVSLRLDETSG